MNGFTILLEVVFILLTFVGQNGTPAATGSSQYLSKALQASLADDSGERKE